MNKLSLFIFIISIGFFACGEATTEQNGSGTAAADEQETPANNEMERSAEQIINHTIEKLDERISLSPDSKRQIKAVYTNAYLAQGGSLDDKFNQDEGRELRKEFVTQTENEVRELLDENQWETYKKVFEERE